jgi:hypothetical protein
MLSVSSIYVAHYSPLAKRREHLERQLGNMKIGANWVENEPTHDEIGLLYNNCLTEWDKKCSLNYGAPIPYRHLNKADISLLFKHIKIWEDIVDKNSHVSLVLEDDVVFEENFVNEFNINLQKTPKEWDFIFIGSGCNLRIPPHMIRANTTAYRKDHPASKCSDSYLVTQDAAKRILDTIIPFTLPIDFELNYNMFLHNMNVYWWDPPITKQGSECGIFSTSNTKRGL